MTYCVAIAVNDGLVFCSDSRTNAGPDMISTYSKMHVIQPADDRFFVVLTSGNLATTQAIVARLQNQVDPEPENLANSRKLLDAARYVAAVSRDEQNKAAQAVADSSIDTSVSLLFGGQIHGSAPGIFLIYSAGNFISDADETPYLQIGESKYGKPILDRIITRETSLEDAARCAIVSMDSTIRSNATVGPPIELLVCENDGLDSSHYARLDADDDYLRAIKQAWNEALKLSFSELPRFEWEKRISLPSLHAVKNEA